MFPARLETLERGEIKIGRLEIRLMAALALALDDGPYVAKVTGIGGESCTHNQ
jgi:hypothetical protein